MISEEKYRKISGELSRFENRIGRRFLSKSISEEEEKIIDDALVLFGRLSYGKEPVNYKSGNIKDDDYYKNTEGLVGKIFEKMEEFGISYFLLLSTKNPIILLNILKKIEEELCFLEITSENEFLYRNEIFKIISDEDLSVSGIFESEFIKYNPNKIKKGGILNVIKHEIIHFLSFKVGFRVFFKSDLFVRNVEELIADFVSINVDLFNVRDGVDFDN